MTLPLPRCALCGKSLARRPYWLVETALPGAPTVGWHMPPFRNCVGTDALVGDYEWSRDGRGLIDVVLKRGRARVRARGMFWASRKAVR